MCSVGSITNDLDEEYIPDATLLKMNTYWVLSNAIAKQQKGDSLKQKLHLF